MQFFLTSNIKPFNYLRTFFNNGLITYNIQYVSSVLILSISLSSIVLKKTITKRGSLILLIIDQKINEG